MMSDENTKPLENADSDTKDKVEQGESSSVAIVPTSPGQLQDVTMDNSYAIGYRSPCVSLQQYTGSTSPAQGRSVREFEEQMATLRKENFNLKLRLYFIEESIPGYKNSDGQDTLMKQLIDAKVEMEILRKEIQEKQDLLKEAAQALNQMEKIQKDTEVKSQAIIDDLNHKIQYLEIENKEMEKSQTGQLMDELLGRSDVSSNINAIQKIRELEGAIKLSEEKITDFQNQIHKLDEILTQRDQTIRECEDKVKELVFQNSELLEQLDNKDKQIATAERSLQGLRQSNKDLREENKSVNDTFETFKMNYMRELSGLKIYENTIKCQQETIAGMQSSLATKTKNLGKLLDRLRDYEQKVTKLCTEKNLTQRENRYFQSIIAKLEKSRIQREENRNLSITARIFPNFLSNHAQKKFHKDNTFDYRAVYELKEKLCFDISSGSHHMRQTNSDPSLFHNSECNLSMEPSVSSDDLDGYAYTHRQKMPDLLQIKSQRLREELQEQKRTLADKICMLEENEDKLKERTAQYESACKTIQKLMLNIKNLQDENDRVKKNTSAASHLKEISGNATECSGLCRSRSDTEGFAESSSLRCEIDKVIEHKDTEIRKLRAEVKKKTANLQNLVNKELWEKNREIERLTKLVNKPNSLPNSPSKEADQLKQSFTDTEYVNALERNKLLQKKVDVLIARLGATNDNHSDSVIRQLREEVKEARDEAERADKWRKECADVCSILTARLEELAGFLDSLLKHKDVLGALAADRRRAMRKAVDRSLDLSKSLNNMSLSITGLSMMDQSLAQLSNLTEILDFSVANKENRTFNSNGEPRSETIENLQAELKALKKELDKTKNNEIKKDRRSLPITFENHSESEAWSEPDRKVSLARIGLEETHALTNCKDERSTDSESELNQSRSKSKTQEKIAQLENMLSQKDERILDIQCQLVEADNRLKRENLRVIEMTRELKELRDEIAVNRKSVPSDQELARTNNLLAKLQEEHDHLTVEAKIAEMQIMCLKKEIEEAKQQHAAELLDAGEQEKRRIDELQARLTNVMEQRLREQEEKHRDALSKDWISKGMYEEHIRQLESLQKKLAEAESTIDYYTENEAEMRQSLVDNELSMRALKKNLDETTLQASKAVLERTKALNEKLQLETQSQELMKQIQTLELQKTELVSKMTALEQQQKLSQRKSSNHGSDISQSGYTSEEVPVGTVHIAVGNQRVNNSSPDLGIESDAGRVSSVELSNAHLSKLKTVEIKSKQMIHEEPVEGSHTNDVPNTQITTITHDCAKVDQENAELRSKLIRTKRALQDTYNKLRTANQRKEQVEKEIKSQILKTHNVLKNVRSNMENEL